MQLALITPLIAILMWRYPVCGYMLCIFLVIFNVTYNMAATYYYDLKIGLLNVNNFHLI